MSEAKAEFIDPREHGQRTLDLRKPLFDESAIARAEDAVQSMSGLFPAWLEDDIARVQSARLAAEAAGWSEGAQGEVHGVAHDLKGLGATYGYPIVTQIAASLCRLVETEIGKAATRENPVLARAHIDALRAVVRAGVKNEMHPLASTLLRELESKVAAIVGGQR